MENLIKKSLELAGFQNVEALTKVVSLSPNPRVAAEVLLNCHTPMTPEDFGFYWTRKYDSDKQITISSIDELANTVTYYVYTHATQTVWFPTEADYKAEKFVVEKPEKNYTSRNIRTKGYQFVETTEKIEAFLENHRKSDAGVFYKWLEESELYVNPKLQAAIAAEEQNNMAF